MFKEFLRRNVACLGAIVLSFGLTVTLAIAGDGIVAELDHNGSVMHMMDRGGGKIEIYYDRPRSGMRRAGVFEGEVLFEGSRDGNRISGTAYVFRKGCRKAGYNVSGRIRGQSFTLTGAAPIRERGGCRVRRYSNSSDNAYLRFDVVSGSLH